MIIQNQFTKKNQNVQNKEVYVELKDISMPSKLITPMKESELHLDNELMDF